MGRGRVELSWVLALAFLGCPEGLASQPATPTPETCRSGADEDGDLLSDTCETALAMAFAPELVVSERSCNWTDTGLGGGYFFGVEWTPDGEGARIAYLPAYFTDCGWRGAKCWIRLAGGCRGHAGDSELVAVEIVWNESLWRVVGVFLSAHCFDDGGCRWYRGDALSGFSWTGETARSGPVVWVAEGKNANYPSAAACDRGHHFYDTCDANRFSYRFPVRAGGNIGSRAGPIGRDGCVGRPGSEEGAGDHGPEECFWSAVAFRGWNREVTDGVTPYERYLARVMSWD